jgi:predicted ATPase
MHIAAAEIRNFRGIDALDLDFTDAFGRVRPLSLLVGPNASGKTSALDALAIAVGGQTGQFALRPDWDIRPSTVIRHGALASTVTCTVRFGADERDAVRDLLALSQQPGDVPDVEETRITWVYPDPERNSRLGRHSTEPRSAWRLFRGRRLLVDLLAARLAGTEWFRRVGGVFTFDQRRLPNSTVPQDIWNYLNDLPVDSRCPPGERTTGDLHTLLRALAVDAALAPADETMFGEVQRQFAGLCPPHRWLGVRRDDTGQITLRFACQETEYDFDGLSSGQEVVLSYLARIARERMCQAVLLVDELELHLHPYWQQQLLYVLPRMGEDNQVIATSHSAHLRDLLPEAVSLGALGDRAREAGVGVDAGH